MRTASQFQLLFPGASDASAIDKPSTDDASPWGDDEHWWNQWSGADWGWDMDVSQVSDIDGAPLDSDDWRWAISQDDAPQDHVGGDAVGVPEQEHAPMETILTSGNSIPFLKSTVIVWPPKSHPEYLGKLKGNEIDSFLFFLCHSSEIISKEISP